MDSTHGVYPSATVLVVDDTPDNLMLIAELLKDKYRVKAANSGEMALRLLQADPLPDLILLDIMMPDMDGYETMREIRSHAEFRNLPMLALTAKAMKGDREKCLEAGASVGAHLLDYGHVRLFSPWRYNVDTNFCAICACGDWHEYQRNVFRLERVGRQRFRAAGADDPQHGAGLADDAAR